MEDISVSEFIIQLLFAIISLLIVGWVGKKYNQFVKFEQSHRLQFRRSLSTH